MSRGVYVRKEGKDRVLVGNEFVEQSKFASPTVLFHVLLLGTFFTLNRLISSQVLMGVRRLDILAKIAVSDTIAKVLLPIILIQCFGLLGVFMMFRQLQ